MAFPPFGANLPPAFTLKSGFKIILDNLFSKKTYNMIISKKPYTAMCVDVFNSEEEKKVLCKIKRISVYY